MRWRRWRQHANIEARLRAEGFQPYNREDFAPGTRGAMELCARSAGAGREVGSLTWQRTTASGALFAYCEACAWTMMLEIRAKRMRGMRREEAAGRPPDTT